MRGATKILGVVLTLCGIAILAMFVSGLATESWHRGDWKANAPFIAIGLGLILAAGTGEWI